MMNGWNGHARGRKMNYEITKRKPNIYKAMQNDREDYYLIN